MKQILAFVLISSVLLSSQAFAHSDYYRCAVAAGSVEATERLCGSRFEYDQRQKEIAREEAARDRYEREREERRERRRHR